MDIRQYIVEEDSFINAAIKKMNKNGRGIIFVCRDRILKGVISDGDIRRYILRSGDITKTIDHVINYSPKKITYGSQTEIMRFMKIERITAVPVVDKKNQIIKICFLDGSVAFHYVDKAVPVVIMAGGKGTRLSPYTNILPKPLIPIGEKTITEHIIERFQNVGCDHFYMIVNYKKNLIKSFFQENSDNITFVDEEMFLGTGGGLKLLEGQLKETFFLTNCDILIDADYNEMLKYHKRSGNLVTIVCAEKEEVLEYGIIQTDNENKVIELKEKPRFSFLINTGLYIIQPEFITQIPEKKFVHITDLIAEYIEEKRIGVYKVGQEAWLDMGQIDALNQMKERLDI